MRIESFRIKPQKTNPAPAQSLTVESLLIRLYVYLLKLYPAGFQAAFADEMQGVFMMTLRNALVTGYLGLLMIIWREIRDLPLNLIRARRQAYNQLPPATQRVLRIQWFVRIVGGLLGLFLLNTLTIILSPSYNLYSQAIPFVVMLFLASTSLLIALRWGRVGGLLTITFGIGMGICIILYLALMAWAEISVLLTLFIGVLWALPFVIFGALFYKLSQHPARHANTAKHLSN